MSNNFLFFDLSSSGINDTLFSIITNCDVDNADTYPYENIDYEYSLLTYDGEGSTQIVNDYYSILKSDNKQFLKESNIFNNEIVNGANITPEEIDFAYPQPFNYSKHDFVFFPTKLNKYGLAKLTIYSTSMNLIYSENLEILNAERAIVRWNGKSNSGNNVSSGIYIFVTESDGEIKKGKIAIISN
jgi:hypothetical protein